MLHESARHIEMSVNKIKLSRSLDLFGYNSNELRWDKIVIVQHALGDFSLGEISYTVSPNEPRIRSKILQQEIPVKL